MLEQERQKLIHKDELNELRTIEINETTQETNQYAAAMLRQQEREQTLQESRFVALGITHKDGTEMQQVKECQRQIGLAMKGNMRLDKEEFRAELRALEEKYDNLLQACERYRESHQRPRTTSGKERLRLVTATMQMAQQEKEQLREKAEELHQAAVKWELPTLVWGNVLGMIRGMEFDVNRLENVRTIGGGTSELQVIRANQKEYYFKEAEQLTTAMEGFQKYCQDIGKDAKEKKIYEGVEALMQDNRVKDELMVEIIYRLNRAKTEEERQAVFTDFVGHLVHRGIITSLELTDQQTQNILQEAFEQYEKLSTRYDVAKLAGISEGEDLSKRNVLTSRMAAIMKMPQLVALSNQAVLHRGGMEQQRGIVMAQAAGIEAAKLYSEAKDANKQVVHTPEMIRQAANLQLFDMICGQVDRNYGNRFYSYEERDGKYVITGVQGIDNDMAFGLLLYERLKTGPQELKRFEQNGICTLPGLDKSMVETLFALRKETLTYCLGDLLEEPYLNALWDRIEGIKKTIEATLKEKPDFLIENWDRKAAERFTDNGAWYFYLSELKKEEIA